MRPVGHAEPALEAPVVGEGVAIGEEDDRRAPVGEAHAQHRRVSLRRAERGQVRAQEAGPPAQVPVEKVSRGSHGQELPQLGLPGPGPSPVPNAPPRRPGRPRAPPRRRRRRRRLAVFMDRPLIGFAELSRDFADRFR